MTQLEFLELACSALRERAEIAAAEIEQRGGRFLIVATTTEDLGEPRIWDIDVAGVVPVNPDSPEATAVCQNCNRRFIPNAGRALLADWPAAFCEPECENAYLRR